MTAGLRSFSSPSAQRRAEEFHELIESASLAGPDETRFAELNGVLTELRAVGDAAPLPRATFAVELRSRLITAAREAHAVAAPSPAAPAPARTRIRRERKIAALLAGVAIATASGSMAVAAQTALPGDSLYPLKRALETAHADVQSGDSKGATMLADATDRLDEVGELSMSDSADASTISRTLQDFAEQATAGAGVMLTDYREHGDVTSLQRLTTFTSGALRTLDSLASIVPVASRADLVVAASTLRHIEDLADAACPGCGAAITTASHSTATAAGAPSPLSTMTHVATDLTRRADLPGATQPTTHHVGAPRRAAGGAAGASSAPVGRSGEDGPTTSAVKPPADGSGVPDPSGPGSAGHGPARPGRTGIGVGSLDGIDETLHAHAHGTRRSGPTAPTGVTRGLVGGARRHHQVARDLKTATEAVDGSLDGIG